jgi:type I restriction enzyme M protein
MAEQLNKKDYLNTPDKIGKLNYYDLGETTIKQLQQNNIIASKTKKFQSKKPDALITNDKKEVVVFVENKDIGKLDTDEEIQDAITQEIEVARAIKAEIFVVTDTTKTYWINVKTGNRIIDEEGNELRIVFKPLENKKNLEKLISRIQSSISDSHDQIREIQYLDPTDLANSIWQKIYVSNQSSPENCLYTFVELFLFKYLSDLGVLKGSFSFNSLAQRYEDGEDSDEEIMAYYLSNNGPREKIKKLFPAGSDGTTVVNGDVFHLGYDENGNPVKNGNELVFRKIIEEFKKYEVNNGKFKDINKDFKSKLFENFLKNETDKKKMGQFFTPLKVVEQMVRMVNIKEGMTICDPASGVGKFLLEAIATDIDTFYKVNGDKLEKKINLIGFDKVSQENSDRTIILAKANMMIYFSKLIAENPELTEVFAKELFNKSFELKKTNLGTLDDCRHNQYDLILTNPPYIVNGSADMKASANQAYYQNQGIGLEALFMEWIVNSLKETGTALVVIPDGILSNLANTKLRELMLDRCTLNGIISLPINTFFGTPKKTFILSISKKTTDNMGDTKKQLAPVFTYICNSIGESLDSYRFDIDSNNLEEAVNQYKLFMALEDKSKFKAIYFDEEGNPFIDKKCKIIPIDEFYNKANQSWVVDNFWTDEEKIELGFKKETNVMTIQELQNFIDEIIIDLGIYKEDLLCLK